MNKLLKPVGLIPLNDRVVVRRLKEREVTKGGIFIAEAAKEKPAFGVVLSSGDSVLNYYLNRRVIVTFGKYSGTEIVIDSEPLLLMREEEITGIIADPDLVESLISEGA